MAGLDEEKTDCFAEQYSDYKTVKYVLQRRSFRVQNKGGAYNLKLFAMRVEVIPFAAIIIILYFRRYRHPRTTPALWENWRWSVSPARILA